MKKRISGTILALTLMFVPLALILSLTVAHTVTFGSGYSLQSQHRARVFYLAESGINIAYRMLQSENFSADTHEPDGTPRDTDDPAFMQDVSGGFGLTLDSDGWYVWRWTPGDPVGASYTRSGLEEEFRFQVMRPTTDTFRIECRARVGNQLEAHLLEGDIHPMFNFVVFDNGDFPDFTRSHNETITGDIHANGDIYLRPYETDGFFTAFEQTSNPRVELTVNSMTAGGEIIRHKDPWGNPDDGGTVEIANALTGKRNLMEGYSQLGTAAPGVVYDSYHDDWDAPLTNSNGALARWDSAVADRSLGAQTKAAALPATFEPGGYYSTRAGLTIDDSTAGSWLQEKTFYNNSEERSVTVKEIDLVELSTSGAWPSNGLLYSDSPVRIVNGHELAGDLTIASASTVYIKGDFNKQFPNGTALDAGVPQHKKAAILTPDRIYRLTSSFEDKSGPTDWTVLGLLGRAYAAEDEPLYPGDDNNTLEANGAFVDGIIPTDARAWVDDPDNPYYVEENGVTIFGIPFPRKVKQVPSGAGSLKVAYAQSDEFLEDLQDVRIVGRGTIGHLRIANMAKFDNSDASDTVTPWAVHTSYIPPKQIIDGEPGKEFEYDPDLSVAGGMTGAPFAPMLGRRVRWSRL